MKKTIALLLLLLFIKAGSAQSSIQIFSAQYGVVNSQTIVTYINPGGNVEHDFTIISSQSQPLLDVDKTNLAIDTGSQSSFVVGGSCYGPNSGSSNQFNPVFDPDFVVQFYQSSFVCDTSEVLYVVRNVYNPSDTAWVKFIYYCVGGLAGINQNDTDEQLVLSPNPASANITLTGSALLNSTRYEIFNVTGQLIYQETLIPFTTNRTVNTSDWEDGLYVVRISYQNGLGIQRKLLVKH
ncbi:MAG: T9SS type A sorting domain-containing protein [Bacteroidetes bacterium]|nr:T9SS type A sorting domain-containing protein [Bacteroidota bacterium]